MIRGINARESGGWVDGEPIPDLVDRGLYTVTRDIDADGEEWESFELNENGSLALRVDAAARSAGVWP